MMNPRTVALALIFISFNASADLLESTGKVEFYKPADHSDTAHFMITGDAAMSMFQHMNQVPETRDEAQGIIVRRNDSMDCTYYLKDILCPNNPECPRSPAFYRCEFRMLENGKIEGGYAPR